MKPDMCARERPKCPNFNIEKTEALCHIYHTYIITTRSFPKFQKWEYKEREREKKINEFVNELNV